MKPDRQAGMSLIELMIGAARLGVEMVVATSQQS